MEIKSVEGRLTILGELDESSLLPQFVFAIPQSSSINFLKILAGANAVMVFPNHSFKIWQIKGSSEIQKISFVVREELA